jgi:hypothetical protein
LLFILNQLVILNYFFLSKVEEVIPTKDTNENISKNYFEKIFLKLKNPIELLKKLKKVEFNNV